MRQFVLLGAAALGLAVLAGPAFAEVTVTANISKDKDITVTETVTKTKTVTINVFMNVLLPGAAEAQALANVTNTENTVCQGVNCGTEQGVKNPATIENSVNTNSGIVGVNQDNGNMVNQANLVSVGVTASSESVADVQAELDQVNTSNTVTHDEPVADVDNGNATATITGSITGNTGVVGVNQNAGNMNNQTNAVAVALGVGTAVALAESALGQVNTGNTVDELNTVKFDTISGSITGNTGVVQVNQSTGNMNNQASVISVAATVSSATIVPPTPRLP
jgi:hypothetical protein